MHENPKVRGKACVAKAQRIGESGGDEVGEAGRSQIMLSYIDCGNDF